MLEIQDIFFEISILVAAASILAWIATLSHQPIIIAYLACGVIAGPWGLRLIEHAELIDTVSEIGVTLLLFLAGMVLHPNRLVQLFKSAAFVTLAMIDIGAARTKFPEVDAIGAVAPLPHREYMPHAIPERSIRAAPSG